MIIVKAPAKLNTISTAGGFYTKMTLHTPPTTTTQKPYILQIYRDNKSVYTDPILDNYLRLCQTTTLDNLRQVS